MNSGADGGTGLRGSTITLIAVLVGVAVIGTASLFRPETAPQEEEVALAAPEAEAPLPDDPADAADEAMETEARSRSRPRGRHPRAPLRPDPRGPGRGDRHCRAGT
jgi:hypothetical protein